jgi:hypothetical protein
MPKLVLTEEQARLVAESNAPVEVVDRQGNIYTPIRLELTAERFAELKRSAASPGPWYTGDQVQARLRALDAEWERTGGFDAEYMRAFLAKLNAEDPGHMRPPRSAG